ncbi:M16 family metallopeptidase [Aureispira anguillae]|uniref:Insulinase family protein n=1 Tax=Aureispira anguillae TaxID=2864201 RepID=A0A915YJC0_9BACT|nr:pitrilysin family protein [Aureispira anguillae]BDS14011.1 insulinase family protein [Aureispira anguillae]
MEFTRYQLDNGLKLLVHQDKSTPLVSVCMTYNVGTRNEQEGKSGFAHLFEHLMFGGSKNAPSFDDYIQQAGGENNAFTNQDMTVYYEYMPCQNIEMALWLEADRMLSLNLNEKTLERERKVVLEEFKESCLNEPYGDIWHHIGPLAYQVHPYQVPTIGKIPKHIEEASLEDVKVFFDQFYCPNNAILSVSGNINPEEVFVLTQKWFGEIKKRKMPPTEMPLEPIQTEKRTLEVSANVPLDAIYLVFHSAERNSTNYYIDDFITDVLAEGDASQLYQSLVKEKEFFVNIDAYITASMDKGLLIVEGKLAEGISLEEAEKAIWEELEQLKKHLLSDYAVEKFQNRIEHNLEFGEMNNLNKAINLGYYELLGDAAMINEEKAKYNAITAADIQRRSHELFQEFKASVLYYRAQKSDKQ